MSHLPLVEKNEASNEVVEILQVVEKKFGFIPNLIRVLATSPSALQAYLTLADLVEKSAFTLEEQQIILLTVSRENKCGYCIAAHSMIATKMADMSKEKLEAIKKGDVLNDEKHQELCRFTAEIVEKRGFVTPDSVNRFLAAGYTDRHVLDILTAVAMKTLSNYANHVAETPIDVQFSEFT